MKTIVLAADHAGFALKETIRQFLENKGARLEDAGAYELVEDDDYPAYMAAAAKKVADDITGQTCAIVFGGSGNGEAMVCNRFPGVRAAVWHGGNQEIVKLSRAHNDANILSIGARFTDAKSAVEAVALWLATPFSGADRHKRRIAAIETCTAGSRR